MTEAKVAFLVIPILLVVVGASLPLAFSEGKTVSIPTGTSVLGCEETKSCFLPYQITIEVGGIVTWSNDDTVIHNVASGSREKGQSGEFNSWGISPGQTFEYQFNEVGQFPYYCTVYPWMAGMVIVTQGDEMESKVGTSAETKPGDKSTTASPKEGTIIVGAPPEDKTTVTGITKDGKLRTEITAMNPVVGDSMEIEIKFRDSTGSLKSHVNYDITALQDGKEVLSNLGVHEHQGIGMHSTIPLNSANKVDIKVTLLGFGLPDDKDNWTGPKGEILMFNVVPEFGSVAIMILTIAIFSIIAVSGKLKLSILPKT